MDISFKVDNEKFNYRVCAIIVFNKKILAMHDERSPYYYLPGGRVKMGETAEQAIIREIKEELNIPLKISRPLWLVQSFFKEDVNKLDYHELCLYFLMDISESGILLKGDKFAVLEGKDPLTFEWLEFARLKEEYFYPKFLKKDIFHLPEHFTIRTEIE